ncbi:MAG: hypothetical protein NTZ68_04485, partial [Candidatus Dependentiae bacterium]|nr:hypothetical protein [Candidatus Dependentiae bacterium]
MKYKIIAFLCIIFCHQNSFALRDYTNNIFMWTRPVFDSIGINQSSWNNFAYAYKAPKKGLNLQVYPIYAQSYDNLENPAYFLFDGKKELVVTAGTASNNFTTTPQGQMVTDPTQGQYTVPSFGRDILGQWIGVTSTQGSTFTVQPRQRQASVMIQIIQDLKPLFESSFFHNWFIDVAIPITWVENNIGFRGKADVAKAFSQPSFQFAKILECDHSSTRLTQAQISLGTKYMTEDDLHVITSSGIIIPLVEQDCNGALFLPIQGFNSHFVINTQALFQFPICKKSDHAVSRILFFFDFVNNFLARNHQLRTYDLKDKPYSRYMKFYDRHKNETVPAMNVLTLRSRVEPFNIVNFATGFRFKYRDSMGEIGYELWAHGSEVLTPEPKAGDDKYVWQEDRYGIAFINQDGVLAKVGPGGVVTALTLTELGQTASESTINYVAAPDGQSYCCPTATFVQQNKYIDIRQLDTYSGSGMRPTITHRGFASIGYGDKGPKRDYFANLGLFIEASQNNAAL